MSEKNVNYGWLKDYDGNEFIPITHSTKVYDNDGKTVEERLSNAERAIDDLEAQEGFKNIKAGSTTIVADSAEDTLEIAAGTGISVVGDATNDKVTIGHSNTVTAKTSFAQTTDADASEENFTVSELTYDAQGHITGKQDKKITLPKDISGNAATASKLKTPITVTITDNNGHNGNTTTFDGSSAATLDLPDTITANIEDKDGEYFFIDKNENVVAKINASGFQATDVTTPKTSLNALKDAFDDLSNDVITEVIAGSGLTGGGSAGSVTLNVGAGNGITVSDNLVSHSDTSALSGAQAAGTGKAITSITVDTFGHVTATGSGNVVTGITAGDGLTGSATSGAIELDVNVDRGLSIVNDKVGHSYAAGTDTTSTANPGYGKTFTVVDSVTKDTYGHVTKVNTKTVTMPGEQTVNNATITIAAGKGLTTGGDFTTNQSSNETITLNVGAGAGISVQDDTVTNAGVRSVAEGTKRGTIAVNTNGTTADVAVNGLGFEDDGSYHFIDNNEKVIAKIDGAGVHATDFIIDGADTSLSGIKTQYTTLKSQLDNTKYAASPSVGGPATSANKLNTNAGSSTNPVYFANGVPVATGNTLDKDISGNAATADKVNSVLTVGTKKFDGSTPVEIKPADLGLAQAMKFLGTSKTEITDGATTNPITIGSTSTTVTSGNVVLYGNKEFVWAGKWEELGNEGSYKITQAAVTSATSTTGNASSFVDGITQDTNGNISYTKKNVQISIDATATDDDVVVLTATDGINAVTYDAKHAKKGPSSGYTSGNTTTSISGSGDSGTIKIPQLTVDTYGHVTAAADENVTITMPSSVTGNAGTADKWKTGRSFSITDNAGHTGTATTGVDGSANVSLDLPNTIAADLIGNITTTDDHYAFVDSKNNTLAIIQNGGIKTVDVFDKNNNALSTAVQTVKSSDVTSTSTVAGVNVGDSRSGNDVTISGTVAAVTTTTAGAMTAADKVKLNGIATGAEVNQNAFSNVKVGSTTIAADAKTDTLELVASTNVTITPDATNDKVTISALDEKVKNEKATTTKAYVTGTTSSSTNTGTQVFDTGVYLTEIASQLHVGSLEVATSLLPDTIAGADIGAANLPWDDVNANSVIIRDDESTNINSYATLTVVTEGINGTAGVGRLTLGNSISKDAETAAGNAKGQILMYGENTGYTVINQNNNTTSSVTITLPDNTGTLATIGNIGAGTGMSRVFDGDAITLNHSNSVTAKTTYQQSADASGSGASFKLTEIKYDAQGHVTGSQTKTITMPSSVTGNAGSATTVKQTVTTTNQDYPILLSGAAASGTNANVYYDSGVTLNPQTNLLRANLEGNIANKDAEYSFIDNQDKVMARISETGMQVNSLMLKEATITEAGDDNALYINSPHTLYFNRPNNTSIVFQQNGTNQVRIDADGNFIPYTSDAYNLGLSDFRWNNIYADIINSTGGVVPASALGASLGSNANPWNNIHGYAHYLKDGTSGNSYGSLKIYTKSTDVNTKGVTQLVLGNSSILGSDTANAMGQIIMYGTNSGHTSIVPSNNTTSSYTLTLPSKTGTLAVTSDLPTVNNSTITVTAGAGLTGTNSFNLNQSSAKTISLAVGKGTGITVSDDAVGLEVVSSVTAGTYGPSAGGNMTRAGFSIPQIKVDSYGRVTDISNKTINLTDSAEANRLLWLDADGKVYGGNHYASGTQVSIANVSKPSDDYTLYVGGTIGASGGIAASSKIITSDNFYLNNSRSGYYLKDKQGGEYPGVYDNGTNLWIGAKQSAGYHHNGQTYISAGYNGTNGNPTIFVAVPPAGNDSSGAGEYGVFHANYLDVGKATEGTLSLARGGTGATTANGAAYNILGNITATDTTAISDTTQVAFRMVTPSAESGVLYTKSASTIYNYVASKATGYTTSGKNYKVQKDSSTGGLYVNVPWANDNTKNTAGSTDTSSKIYLIGATSQATNPQTYSHDTVYITNKGILYSPTYITQSGTGYGTESTMNGLTGCVVGQVFFVTG